MMDLIFDKLIFMSVAGGIVGGIILTLNVVTKKHFTSKWNYYICIVPFMVMSIPFSFPIGMEMPQVQTPPAAMQTIHTENIEPAAQSPILTDVPPAPEPETSWNFDFDQAGEALPFIWLAGFLIIMLYKLGRQIQFHKHLQRITIAPQPNQEALFHSINPDKRIRLKAFDGAGTPFIAGIWKPTVYVPNTEISDYDYGLVLQHELTHIKRHDLLYRAIADLITTVHFFNPVAYLLKNHLHHYCELSCDEAVAQNMDAEQKRDYGKAILHLMKANNLKLQSNIGLCEHEKTIKNRLEVIMRSKKTTRLTSALSIALVGILTVGGLALASVVNNYADHDVSDIQVSYMGKTLEFKNSPIIKNGEVYLPLRELLTKCDLKDSDITWNQGEIEINIASERIKMSGNSPEILIKGETYRSETPLLIKDDIAYIPLDFIEKINISYELLRPLSCVWDPSLLYRPEAYYVKGEEVFIGTGEEQNNYNPVDENGKRKIIKRIITDETGDVIAVATVENQMPSTISRLAGRKDSQAIYHGNGFADLYNVRIFNKLTGKEIITGIFVMAKDGKDILAYIPPAYQIKRPVYQIRRAELEKEAPLANFSVQASNVQIPYTIGEDIDAGKNLKNHMAKISFQNMPYVKLNDIISVHFDSELVSSIKPVSSIKLKDFILNRDGSIRYSSREVIERPVSTQGNAVTFWLEPHMAAMLSSNSDDYAPGNSIRGFQMEFVLDGKQYVATFVLRSDAGD